ncbi:hypothetical protein HEP73_04278 [Xanthomonas sp. GW]|uniref:hypothetical protein n=1 Tax=Xanthomonas sp. GW TaxID=2724121 RepID=UPI00163A02E7|nr:hypothetical protein [Xanthomonas sp. GW]QNH23325.1 hypothetical protein HEP73_04278 [Xanthomonas sp. GW]
MLFPEDLELGCSFSGYDKKSRIRVMLFHPRGGSYPRGTFFCDDGFFHADEDLTFTVVRCSGWRSINEDVPFSEFAWASPAQVRVLGALLLCQTFDGAWIRLYPVVGPELILSTDELDLDVPYSVQMIKERLLLSAKERHLLPNIPCVPANLLNEPYHLLDQDIDMDRFLPSYQRIDPSNFVLMRGLQALVKSDMLGRHREFGEESVIAAFIALDASFSLVQRELRLKGLANPSANDAARWLHRNFYEPFGHEPPGDLEKYFEEFYDSRISTLHPGNRFGDFPFSPTMWDDAIHLRSQLRQVFSFLVHGRHFKDFEDAVDDYHAQRNPRPVSPA